MRAAGPLLLFALLLVPLAGAHASLQSATPPPGGHADEGVTVIEYVFTEDVEREYTDADLLDAEGNSLAAGPVEFDEERHNVIRLPVQPLPSGIYSASWKALSADTHTTRGTFVFSVGNASLRPGEYATSPSDPAEHDTSAVVRDGFARFAFYVGLFLVAGMPLFALVVLREMPPRGLFGTAASFGLVGAAGALVGLLFLADRTQLGAAVVGTDPGRSLVARGLLVLAASVAVGVATFRPQLWRVASAAAVGLGAAAIYATATGSHAAALRDNTLRYIIADGVHLAAATVWVGGIVAFLHVLVARSGPALSVLVLRFTTLAIPSVALLLATGTVASLAHMPCFDEGLDACREAAAQEPYMRLVALKLALMLPLIALGAYNAFLVKPRLASGAWDGLRLRRVVQVEAILLAVVVGAAGVLAASAPPETKVEEGSQPASTVFELQNTTSKSHVILQIEPNPVTVGLQKIVIIVHPLGAQLPNGTIVALKIYPATSEEPETILEPTKVTPNEWEIEGAYFTSAETWKVMVILQRPDEFSKIPFEVPVSR